MLNFPPFRFCSGTLVRWISLGMVVSQPSAATMSNTAESLMQSFARRTGLMSTENALVPARESPGLPRYLWTDSFAVCNFIGLGKQEMASSLIEHVHHTLARERSSGDSGQAAKFLDGASEDQPTLGGIRIGKKLEERGVNEPFNERLEWDRDGQYFHYLTKWMLALDRAALHLQQPQYNVWARELAERAHRGFVYGSGSTKRMYWKMSIDLSRPLVPSQGHHDPLDGLITALELQETAKELDVEKEGPSLENVVSDYQAMIAKGGWSTTDSLGLGGLLSDASRVDAIMRRGRDQISSQGNQKIATCSALLEGLLRDSLAGLKQFARGEFSPDEPAAYRLAFRELGLSIGLAAVEQLQKNSMDHLAQHDKIATLLGEFAPFVGLRKQIDDFWLKDANQQSKTYTDHQDINDVMLATTLSPSGFLLLPYRTSANKAPREEL